MLFQNYPTKKNAETFKGSKYNMSIRQQTAKQGDKGATNI